MQIIQEPIYGAAVTGKPKIYAYPRVQGFPPHPPSPALMEDTRVTMDGEALMGSFLTFDSPPLTNITIRDRRQLGGVASGSKPIGGFVRVVP